MITSLNNLDYLLQIQRRGQENNISSPRTRKHNELSHPKTRLAASFCAAVQIRIYITIEAIFVALVGTIQKIITRYVRFSLKLLLIAWVLII